MVSLATIISMPRFFFFLIPLNPSSDYHPISPYSVTAEANVKVMRMKKMITNYSSFGYQINPPCQYHNKCKESSMENMYTDVRV